MSKLVNYSLKIPKEIRELMRKLDVNWSKYLRVIIEKKIREELAKEASKNLDKIRKSCRKVSTEDIVKWIREDRMR